MSPAMAKAHALVKAHMKPACWRDWKGDEYGNTGSMTIRWAHDNIGTWLEKLDPEAAWQPWQPDDKQPWSPRWAGHLYRRAGFGAGLVQLRQAVADGFDATFAPHRTGGRCRRRVRLQGPLRRRPCAAQRQPSSAAGGCRCCSNRRIRSANG
jgi:hypothetical protein